MSANNTTPSFVDVAFMFAPLWGPILLAPIFMLFPFLDFLRPLVAFVGVVAFPALGVRGLLRTSNAGPVLKFVVGSVYFFPAMLFCAAAFWGVCMELLDSCNR